MRTNSIFCIRTFSPALPLSPLCCPLAPCHPLPPTSSLPDVSAPTREAGNLFHCILQLGLYWACVCEERSIPGQVFCPNIKTRLREILPPVFECGWGRTYSVVLKLPLCSPEDRSQLTCRYIYGPWDPKSHKSFVLFKPLSLARVVA